MKLFHLAAILLISAGLVKTNSAEDPRVTSINPRSGSLAGKTRLLISGTGFPDQYEGNKVYLETADGTRSVECPVDKQQSTSVLISCDTSAAPAGWYYVRLYDKDGVKLSIADHCRHATDERCRFRYMEDRTPYITKVSPKSGPPGTLVTIDGKFFTSKYQTIAATSTNGREEGIKRAYLGTDRCDLVDDATGLPYDISLDNNGQSNWGHLKCKMKAKLIGSLDASIDIEGSFGRSLTTERKVSAGGVVHAYQSHAEILSVSPSKGSELGGTLVTIKGRYFNYTATRSTPRVLVGGQPCEVVGTATFDTIQCITQPAPETIPAVWAGSRGAMLEQWNSTTAYNAEFERVTNYTKDRTGYWARQLEGFWWDDGDRMDYFVTRMRGLFVPPKTGMWQFYIKSDDASNLYMSPDEDPAKREKVAFCNQYRPEFTETPDQKTAKMMMQKGKKYYMEATQNEGHGGANVYVAARYFDTDFTSADTEQAWMEQQKIMTSSTTRNEGQTVRLSGDWTAVSAVNEVQTLTFYSGGDFRLSLGGATTGLLNTEDSAGKVRDALNGLSTIAPEEVSVTKTAGNGNTQFAVEFMSEQGAFWDIEVELAGGGNVTIEKTEGVPSLATFALELGGSYSDPIALDADEETVRGAVLSMLGTGCPDAIANPSSSVTKFFRDYEEPPTSWQQGTRVPTEKVGGLWGLKRPHWLYHWTNEGDINLQTYKYTCFAYKWGATLQPRIQLLIAYDDENDAPKTSWPWYDVGLKGDNEWHYTCINLYDKVTTHFTTGKKFHLRGVLFLHGNSIPQDPEQDIFVDNFYIGRTATVDTEDGMLSQCAPGPALDGNLIQDAIVTKVVNETAFNITFVPYDCGHNFPLMGVRSSQGSRQGNSATYTFPSTGSSAQVTVRRDLSATSPITGTMDITYKRVTVSGVPADVSASGMQAELETAGTGKVSVTRDGTCSGYTWTVDWQLSGGDKPALQVDGSGLVGHDAAVGVDESQDGGLFISPLGGDYTELFYDTPQAQVYVSGIPSSCAGDCSFEWSTDVTPTITDLSPTSGSASTVLTIGGSGFSTNTSLNSVKVGGIACAVATATADQITCSVQEGAGGTHAVEVKVDGKGYAKHVNETFAFTVVASIDGISPTAGSLAGGTPLTISGSGFGDDYVPSVDGVPCPVSTITYNIISCTTPARSSAGAVPVTVYQGDTLGTTLTSPASFTFDTSLTPIITGVNNTVAKVEGGTVAAISGSGFGSGEGSTVKIGDEPAEILSYSDTEVVVATPAQARGSYPVRVYVNGKGYADTSTNSVPNMMYRLVVTNVTPNQGSLLGGTHVLIKGEGFSETAANNSVMFGNVPCDVLSADSTNIVCVTGTRAQTHVITNDGTHPVYGVGFAWSRTRLTVHAGDKVRWQFQAPPRTTGVGYRVLQTSSASSLQYDGVGFKSGAKAAAGAFEHTFTTLGTYYYNSGPVDTNQQINMKGSIVVQDLAERNNVESLELTQGGFEAEYDLDSGTADPTDSPTCPGTVANITGCTDDKPSSNSSADGFPFRFWSCSTPRVASISRNNGTVHDNITISGSGFGSDDCMNEVTIGGYTADCSLAPDDTDTLVCNANPHDDDMADPMPIHTYHPISLCVNNRGCALPAITRLEDRSFVLLPNIDSVSPELGSLAGGTSVIITGNGFSSSTQVAIAGQACNIVTVTYTRIECITRSAPQTRKRSTTQNVAGQVTLSQSNTQVACSSNCGFTYSSSATPTVTDVEPTVVSGAQTQLSINGTLFGTDPDDVTITVGSEECSITHIEDDFIQCDLGAVEVGFNDFTLNVAGKGDANSAVARIESLAEIDTFNPTDGGTQGGTTLTITGNGFVADDTTIMFGSSECAITEISLLQVKCTVPAHAAGTVNVVTTSNGVLYPVQQFEYSTAATPEVDSIAPAIGSSGDPVTLTGSNFGTDSSDITVSIDGVRCVVTSVSDMEIECTVGSHSAGTFPVRVLSERNGLADSSASFTYELSLDSVSPNEGSFGGGSVVTMTGAGFDPQLTQVTICNRLCKIIGDPDPDQLTCEVPSNPDTSQSTKACPVSVSVNGASYEEGNAFTYKGALTPQITRVSPNRGGTAGGTVVTITGSGFSTSGNIITIAGSSCVVQSESATEIVCITEAHSGTAKSKVIVKVGGKGAARHTGAKPEDTMFYYVDVWSSRFTWGGEDPPEEGDLVVVPEGMTLLLDVTTPVLKVLLIEGGEVVFDETDLELNAENILITNGGLLQVGTEDEPFQHKGIITMHGHPRSRELPVYGAKTLATRNGTLELHGIPTPVTWTHLSQTAEAGDTTLHLVDSVNWNVGDHIVIATTGDRHSQRENEELVISAISSDGMTLTLTEALEYDHISVSSTYTASDVTASRRKRSSDEDSITVEYQAEVGLLTHNVGFRGSNNEQWADEIDACEDGFDTGEFNTQTCFQGRFGDELGSDQFGAQIMFHSPVMDEKDAMGHLSYVELNYVGQAFRLGRYAIHWHILGDMEGAYVRGCSIHNSFNRAVNVHNTHNVTVEDVVFYDIMGGAMFTEDGIERDNKFYRNLGVFVKSSTSLLNDDITPANFWVTNPDNIYINNTAVGGTHFGFWYRMHEHPDGPSFDENIWPRSAKFGTFENNEVHSQGWFGIWIFQEYAPTADETPNGDPEPAKYYGLKAWNNEKGAEWVNCAAIQWHNFVLANNEKAGLEFKRVTGPQEPTWGDALVKDNWIVGRDDNLLPPSLKRKRRSTQNTPCTKLGVILPFDHYLTIDGVKFVDFDQSSCAALGVTSIDGVCTHGCGGFEYRFANIKFNNVPNMGKFRWDHEALLVDTDGTLTGTSGAKIVVSNPSLPSECVSSPDFSRIPGSFPASLCPASVDFVRFAFKDPTPSSLNYKDAMFESASGRTYSPYLGKRVTHKPGWMVLLQEGAEYKFWFNNSNHLTNISYSGTFSQLDSDESIVIRHEFTQKPDRFGIIPGVTKEASSRPLSLSDNNGDYYFDTNTNALSYIISGKDAQQSPASIDMRLQVYRCYYADCAPPPDPNTIPPARERPDDYDVWSDPSLWVQTEEGSITNTNSGTRRRRNSAYGLPQDGDDVTIAGGTWMVADTDLPEMNKLLIYGVLEFEDNGSERTLTATYVLVLGGRLIIGWEDNPYESLATIVLTGNHNTLELVLPSITPGAKVLGCFGGCDLHGKNTNYPKTKLAQTAAAGDRQLVVQDPVDWEAGDEIVLTTSDYDPWHTETLTLDAVSGNTLTLNEPVAYRHLGETYTLADGTQYTMAASVGRLTRNVKIIGGDYADLVKESFGGRVLVSRYADEQREYIGYARISNTEFYHTGQLGWTDSYDPRYSMAYVDTGEVNSIRPSYFRKNAIHDGFSPGIGSFGTDGLEIEDNIVHHTVGEGINDEGESTKIRRNLVALTIWPGDWMWEDRGVEESNIDWTASIKANKARSPVLQGNVVAGSEKAGYHVDGEPGDPAVRRRRRQVSDEWSDNEAHGVLIGVLAFKDDCVAPTAKVRDFYIWKAYDYGVYWQTRCNLEMSDLTIVDAQLAIFDMVIGPSPLSHQPGNKYSRLEDSVIIGRSEDFDCTELNFNPKPPYIKYSKDGRSWKTPSGGFVGKAPCLHSGGPNNAPEKPFSGEMTYPTIDGLCEMEDVTFANFGTACGSEDVAFMLNPKIEDTLFPTYASGINWVDVPKENKVFYGRPSLGKVNPSDCVDMYCDAKFQGLVIDIDGSFLGSAGTVVPEHEWQWDDPDDQRGGRGDYRIPTTLLTDLDGNRLDVEDICPDKGIVRDDSCTYIDEWQAYECHDEDYELLSIESLDADTETRRLSPLVLVADQYCSMYNGPQDHGWCAGYTCQKRISTFNAVVTKEGDYEMHFTGYSPQNLRLRLLARDAADYNFHLTIFYAKPYRLDVYRNNHFVIPKNGRYNEDDQLVTDAPDPATPDEYIPALDDPSGSNYVDHDKRLIYLTIRGDDPIDIRTQPVLQVAFGMPAVSDDVFYGDNLRQNLASFLSIPAEKIRVVNVVREDPNRRKKRAADTMQVEVEIIDPPAQDISDDTEEQAEASRQELQEATSRIVDGTQLGTISDDIGYEVQSLAVVEPLPSANSSDWGEVAEELESGENTEATAIQIPARIVVHTQPDPRGEGAAFPVQPILQVFDGSGAVVKTLGASSSPWEVEATIKSGTGTDSRAVTLGDRAVFKNGWANFTNLAISHSGEGYVIDFIIVKPASATRFNTSSIAVDVEERGLSGRVMGTDSMMTVDEAFTLSVVLTDSYTEEDVQDIAWKGHTWQCTVQLDPLFTQDGGGQSATLTGTKTVTFDPATGRATFSDLTLNRFSRYHLRFHVTSSPEDHDFWVTAEAITVWPANHTSPVIEDSAHVTLTLDGSYQDAVVGKEDYLETLLWLRIAGGRTDVIVGNFTFTEGSVVTDFDVQGTDEGVNSTLIDLYDQVKDGMTIDLGGSTLRARRSMLVDGQNYYGTDGGPPAAPPAPFPVVPVVVVIVILLLIVIAIAAFYCYRKNKQQQVVHLRNKVVDDVPLKPSPSSQRAADTESGLGSTNTSFVNVRESSEEDLPPVPPNRSPKNSPIHPQPVLPPMSKGHTQVTPIGSRTSSPLPEVNVTSLCRTYQEPDATGRIAVDVVVQGHDSRFFKLGQCAVKVSGTLQELRKELTETFPRLKAGRFVYLNATMTDRIPKAREEFTSVRDMGSGPVLLRLT